jgi:hypothetical protein
VVGDRDEISELGQGHGHLAKPITAAHES